MLKQITLILVVTVLISSCMVAPPRYRVFIPVEDNSKHYRIERVSFLPPQGDGWIVGIDKRGVLQELLRFDKKDVYDGSSTRVYVESLKHVTYALEGDNFINNHSYQEQLDQYKKKVTEELKRTDYNFNSNVRETRIRNMRCIRQYSDFIRLRSETLKVHLTYRCEQSNQPKDFPLISFELYHRNHKTQPPIDGDSILLPIIESVEFHPVDRANSEAYQQMLEEKASYEDSYRRSQRFKQRRDKDGNPVTVGRRL